jgi:hypothetical protein
MRLDDFVAQTLTALVQGVQDAHVEIEPMGGRVNPFRAGSTGAIQVVEFDVEVSTVAGTASASGLGVFVGPVGAGTRGQSEASSSCVGRIRFRVPLELPTRIK